MDESKDMLVTTRWVTTEPGLGLTLYAYGGRLNNHLQGRMPETGDGPNHVPNLEYFLPLESSTNDLGSLVHRVLDRLLLDSLSRPG